MSANLLHVTVLFAAAFVIVICVIVHYEALRFLGQTLGAHVHRRIGILLVMFGLLLAHMVEIWIFAFGYWIATLAGLELGHIAGVDNPGAFDYMYLSVMAYTTVGFGDVVPVGAIRMLAAAEALTGLSLITWSASFTFLAMQRFWPAPWSGQPDD
jgi:Ion channel